MAFNQVCFAMLFPNMHLQNTAICLSLASGSTQAHSSANFQHLTVVCHCGKQILVELAIEREQELPALIYEARPVGRPYQRGHWGRRNQEPGMAVAPTEAGATADGSPSRVALLSAGGGADAGRCYDVMMLISWQVWLGQLQQQWRSNQWEPTLMSGAGTWRFTASWGISFLLVTASCINMSMQCPTSEFHHLLPQSLV